GTYGLVFMNSVLKTANFVRQTEFDLPTDKLDLFRTFIKEGIFGVMHGKTMDWNVVGRGISRQGVLQKDLREELKILQEIDTLGAPEYRKIQQKKPTHRHFWKTDFTVHT